MATKNISIGIIGAGYWGSNLIRNFSAADGCDVSYVCDENEGRFDNFKKAYPDISYTTNFEKILNDDSVSAVVIATPVASHFQLAKKALLAGKHVFVEKPMTETSRQSEELIEIAEKNNLILHVDHTFLYYGPILKIKELIDSKELGDLNYFDSQRMNLGLLQDDVNVFWDLAPHDISILNFLYPHKPISVVATGTNHVGKKHAELAHVTIEYDTGFVAHIHVSWLSPVKLRGMILGGNKKMIYFDDIEPSEKIKVYDKSIELKEEDLDTYHPVYTVGDARIPTFDNKEALLSECNHFVDCVKNGKKSLTDARSGLEVVRLLEAADQSLAAGGNRILL